MRLPVGGCVLVLLAAPLVLSGSGIHYLPGAAAASRLLVGLILASPIFGVFYLFYRFTTWHRGFHRRMKEPRR